MADLNLIIRADARQAQATINALRTQIAQANQAAANAGITPKQSSQSQLTKATAQAEATARKSAANIAAIERKAQQQSEQRAASHASREQRIQDAHNASEERKAQAHATKMAGIEAKSNAAIANQRDATIGREARAAQLSAAKVAQVRQATAAREVQAELRKNAMIAAAEQQAILSSARATEQKAVSQSRMTVAETRAAEAVALSQAKQSAAHAKAATEIAVAEAKKVAATERSSLQMAVAEQSAMASIARSQASYDRSMASIDATAQRTSNNFVESMRQLGRAGNNIQWTGRQLESNFTVPLGIAGAAAGYFALQSETSMVRVRKIYGDASMSTQQLTNETEALERASHALGATYGQSISVVQDTMADWIATGVTGAAAFRATELSLKTALLGELDLAKATESLISIQGQYNLSTTEMAAAVDTLNMAEQNAGAKYGDYIEAMEKSAGAARAAGVDISHLTAFVSSLVPQAGSAAQAGNALKTIFSRLLSPTREAAQVMGLMGINTKDAAWQSMNGAERLELMAQKYVKLADNVKGAGERSEETGKMISSQAMQVSKSVASTWQISRFETLMRDLADENGRYATVLEAVSDEGQNAAQSQKELNAILDSNPMTLKQIGVAMQGYLINMIKPLLPVIVSLAATVATLVRNFAELPYPIQAVVIGGLALLAVFGPIAKYAGSFISLFGILGGVGRMAGDALGLAGTKVASTTDDYALATGAISNNTRAAEINAAGILGAATAHETAAARIRNADMAASAPSIVTATGTAKKGAADLPDTTIIANGAKKAGDAYDDMGNKAVAAGGKAGKSMTDTAAKTAGTAAVARGVGPMILKALTNPWVLAVAIIVGVLAAFWDQIVVFFQSMILTIQRNWALLPAAIKAPLVAVVNMVRDAAMAVYEWFSYLNPWARHSPSLVEQVTTGMAEVQRQYGYVGNVGAPFMKAAKDLKAFKDAVARMPASKAAAAEPRKAISKAGDKKALALYDQMGRHLDNLNAKQDRLNQKISRQQAVVNTWSNALERANAALDRQQKKLDALTKVHDDLAQQLSDAESKMNEYASAPLKGMGAMEDAIFANEMAQKRLQLQIAKLGDTDEYKKAADQVALLQGEIETLTGRRAELYNKGAGSDILGPIDNQLKTLRDQQKAIDTGSGDAISKVKALEDELKRLQDQATILDLEKSLKFDELTRKIEKAADTSKEMTFTEAINGVRRQREVIDALTPRVNAANEAMKRQQTVVDSATEARDRISDVYDRENKKLEALNNTYESTAKLIREIEDSMNSLSSTVDRAAQDREQAKSAKKAADEAKKQKKAADAARKASGIGGAGGAGNIGSPGAKNFMDAAGGGYEDPGGISNLGREGGLGDQSAEIDKLTEQMNQNLFDKFAKLDLFGPIREKWDQFKGWMSKTFDPGFAEAGRIVGTAFTNGLAWIGDIMNSEWFKAGVEAVKNFFTDVLGGDAQEGLKGIEDIKGAFQNAWDAIKNAWDRFINSGIGDQLKSLWDSILNLAEALWPVIQLIGVVIGAVIGAVTLVLAAVWGAIKGFLPPLIEFLGVIIGAVIGIVGGIINIIVGLVTGIVNIVSGVINVIVGFVQTVIGIIVGIFTGNWTMLQDGAAKVVDGLGQIITGIGDFFIGLYNGIRDILVSLWDLIVGAFKFVVTAVVGIVAGFINGIIDWFEWLFDVLVGNSIVPDMVNAIVDWFGDMWNRAVTWVSDMVNGVIQWFSDMNTRAINLAMSLVNGVITWFVNMRNGIVTWISDAVEWVVTRFQLMRQLAVARVTLMKIAVITWFINMRDGIVNKATEARDWVVSRFTNMKNWVVSRITNLKSDAIKKFLEIRDGIVTKAREARDWVVDRFKEMKNWALSRLLELKTNAITRFQEIRDGLVTKAREARDWVADRFKAMKNWAVSRVEELRDKANTKLREARDWLKDRASEARDGVADRFKAMKNRVIGWAEKMRDGIKSPIKSFANNLRSPINNAIDAVNGLINGLNKIPEKLPGLDWKISTVPHVPKFEAGTANIPTMRVGAGKTVSNARAIVGEGNSNYKEYVVPTDPKHRKRAVNLHRSLGRDLGVPMYAKGGILDNIKNAAGNAVKWAKEKGGGVLGNVKNWTTGIWDKLKDKGKGLLSDAAKWVTDHASNAMSWLVNPLTKAAKKKISDIFPGSRGEVPRKTGHWTVDQLDGWAKIKDKVFEALAEQITAESGGGDYGAYTGGNGKGWQWQMKVLRSQFPGLGLNSGFRPGAVTASGNKSYHSKGLAVDVPPRMDVFNFLAGNFPGTAELIFTRAGRRQIKNGKNYVYRGAVASMHRNHVHWAYTGKGMRSGFKAPGGASFPGAPGGSRGSVVQRVKKFAQDRFGWGTGANWNALYWLVNKESSWNPRAANPRSSARGLFQKMTSIHGPVEPTPEGQAAWGLRYIKSRYGNPVRAAAFHRRNNWYRAGIENIGLPAVTPAMLANGGIVRSTRKGTSAVIGEGARDEAVFQLPAGWQTTFSNFGTLSTDIMALRDATNSILAFQRGALQSGGEKPVTITNVTYNTSTETNVYVTGNLEFPNVKDGDDVSDLIEALKAVAKD